MTAGRRNLGWLIATAAAVAVHAGAAAALLRHAAPVHIPPDPLVIDLVPAEAPPAPPSFDVPPSPLPQIDTPPEFPEAEPEPNPEPEPVEPPPEPEEPDLAQTEAPVEPPTVRPMSRPRIVQIEPEPKVQPKPKREPKRQPTRTDQPKREAPKAAATASRTERAPTGQPGRTASAQAAASYKNTAQQAIARHMSRKRYSLAGVLVSVSLTVATNGQVIGASITSSSGNSRADAEVIGQLRRLTRLPAPPSQQVISVSFRLR